jgi:hypothetical protein
MSLSYFYIFWALAYLLVWVGIFWKRKKLRREMLYISILFAVAGPVADFLYFKDWWQPETILGGSISIESVIIGFSIGGIAAVIYDCIQPTNKKCESLSSWCKPGMLFVITFGLLFFTLHYAVKLNLFYTTLFSYSAGIVWIYRHRADLIKPSLLTGVYLMLFGVLTYWVLLLFFDGYFEAFWILGDHWYGHFFLGIPIAEYVWYFFTGAFIGPLYEFIKDICK